MSLHMLMNDMYGPSWDGDQPNAQNVYCALTAMTPCG